MVQVTADCHERSAGFVRLRPALRVPGRTKDVVVSLFGTAPSETDVARDNNRYCRIAADLDYGYEWVDQYETTLRFRESL